MSDERDTREDGNGADPDAGDAAQPTDSAVNKPSGKRSTRRRTGGVAVADEAAESPTEVRPTGKAPATKSGTDKRPPGKPKAGVAAKDKGRGNPFKRLRRFLREVIAELRKVIWPNRKQMITYTSVVLVFLVFMVALIAGLDLAFIKAVSWLFG